MWLGAGSSIRRKLGLILAASTGMALVLAATALLAVEARQKWQAAQAQLAAQAEVLALASEAALAFGDRAVGGQYLAGLQAQRNVEAAALYDAGGTVFARFQSPAADLSAIPEHVPQEGMRFDWFTATIVRPVLSNREPIGSVYIRTRHGLLIELAEYVAWLAAIGLGSLAGALALAQRMQRTVTGPIEEVSRAARSVLRDGSFEVRAVKRSDDEVGQLVDAFNAMLDELGRRARVLEQANTALRSSEERYQLAAQGSSAGLWDWDLRAGTMYHSPRLKFLLGYSEEEFPDRPDSIPAIMHADDLPRVRAALRQHLASQAPYQAECRVRQKDGRLRWFLVTGMALRDARGRAYRMAGSLIDISERKESELLLQEANRAKDQFLATLAHELRNPLAPLRTGLQILKAPNAAPAVQHRTLDTMDRQLTHMVRLIDDLLDISRINSGKVRLEMERTSLRAALQTALELARPAIDAAGHAMSVELPDDDIELHGDSTRLAQTFGNLLNNAAKYTPAGGRIGLRVWREGDQVWVEVEDNGVGIPPEMLETVFGLFTQVPPSSGQVASGLGIGLFLVRTLVEMHAGSVTARSRGSGQGSTFTVALPALTAQGSLQPAPDAQARIAAVPREALRILVVDDNRDAAETLATFLEILGSKVRAVHLGLAAVDATREFRPGVVLLDIGLPDIDGYEVARRLRLDPECSHVLLVALTGWGAEKDRRRAQAAGFDHHLTKPVDMAVLEELLRKVSAECRR